MNAHSRAELQYGWPERLIYEYVSVLTKSKRKPQQHFLSWIYPILWQQVLEWHVNNYKTRVGSSKKAFKKDPATTDPQCLVKSRFRGVVQEVAVYCPELLTTPE